MAFRFSYSIFFTSFLKTTGGSPYVRGEEERGPKGWAGESGYRCSLFAQPLSFEYFLAPRRRFAGTPVRNHALKATFKPKLRPCQAFYAKRNKFFPDSRAAPGASALLSILRPPLFVEVAAMDVVDHRHREILHPDPPEGLGSQILVGDDIDLLDATGDEGARAADGAQDRRPGISGSPPSPPSSASPCRSSP